MAVEIFFHSGGATEETLTLEDDGALVLFISENYPPRSSKSETMTVEQAKQRWPQYGAKIDKARFRLPRSN